MEKKAERERVLLEDDDPEIGFTLVADLKWNQQLTEELYVLALCRLRGLRTLRDLTKKHIPLLRNILERSLVSRYVCKDSKEMKRGRVKMKKRIGVLT